MYLTWVVLSASRPVQVDADAKFFHEQSFDLRFINVKAKLIQLESTIQTGTFLMDHVKD